jgi:hypothetical protein
LLLAAPDRTGSATRSCARSAAIMRSTSGKAVAAVSFIAVERREVVHERRGFRMIRSDGLFADRKGAPEQRLGVGITVLALIEIGEIV